MKQEQDFFNLIKATETYIQDIMLTGASQRDLEELLWGNIYFSSKADPKIVPETSFKYWIKIHNITQ